MLDEIIVEEKNNVIRLAGLQNGDLREFIIQDNTKANEGNIYLGKVTKKIQTANGKEGYFINIGDSRDAFINAEEKELENLRAHEGQDVVVQVSQEQRAEKGARMVRFLHLAGVNLVYCPYGEEIEISAKITDDEKREQLFNWVAEAADDGGFIIRTHAAEASKEDILTEIKQLKQSFEDVIAKAKTKTLKAPSLLLAKNNIVDEIIYRHKDVLQRVIVNTRRLAENINSLFEAEYVPMAFDEAMIVEKLNDALQKTIKLKSGGRVIIEETKAFVSIDVDSGEGTVQGGFSRLNQEAAREIAKQIVLRNLSGKIIIDFAGGSEYKFLKSAIDILDEELKQDFAKARVLGLSRAGNVEIIRMRRRPSLSDLLTEECPTCLGCGRVEK